MPATHVNIYIIKASKHNSWGVTLWSILVGEAISLLHTRLSNKQIHMWDHNSFADRMYVNKYTDQQR